MEALQHSIAKWINYLLLATTESGCTVVVHHALSDFPCFIYEPKSRLSTSETRWLSRYSQMAQVQIHICNPPITAMALAPASKSQQFVCTAVQNRGPSWLTRATHSKLVETLASPTCPDAVLRDTKAWLEGPIRAPMLEPGMCHGCFP